MRTFSYQYLKTLVQETENYTQWTDPLTLLLFSINYKAFIVTTKMKWSQLNWHVFFKIPFFATPEIKTEIKMKRWPAGQHLSYSTTWGEYKTRGPITLLGLLQAFPFFYRFPHTLFCMYLSFERGLRAPPFSVVNTQHGSRAEGWPPSLALSWCGVQVWIRQPAVTADHGSCQPENFSRQSRFIANCFRARLMPGLRWRIALWCSHWARRLRLTHGRAMVTWLITGELYGEKGDGKHKVPTQSILFTGNSEWAPNWKIRVQ